MSGRGVNLYFFESVLGIATLDEDWRPSGIDFVNVICLLLTWIIIGTCMILSGMKWSKNLAYFTLAFPAVTLFGLLIRSLTLPGARNGVSMYLGSWEWSTLTDKPDIWSTAAVQTLFSLGVCFGTMPAFGSRCEVHAPTFQNTMIISSISFAFAILSSVCAFGIIGYLTALMGDFRVETGSALIFTVYSAAFSTIAGSLHWLRFIFLSLFSLGLIGAFSVIHAIVMAVEDSTLNGVLLAISWSHLLREFPLWPNIHNRHTAALSGCCRLLRQFCLVISCFLQGVCGRLDVQHSKSNQIIRL